MSEELNRKGRRWAVRTFAPRSVRKQVFGVWRWRRSWERIDGYATW